jgi:hypothetical protein
VDQRAIWSALTASGTPEHFVNVVAIGDAVPPIVVLDGVNVSGQLDPMSGAPEVYTAQFTISEGEHELYCPTGCLGSAYGFGDYNSYSFHLGYGATDVTTSISEPDGSTSTTAISMASGDAFMARMLGLHAWTRLHVLDATGREVLNSGPGTRMDLSLPPGHYVARAIDNDGRALARRIFVRQP